LMRRFRKRSNPRFVRNFRCIDEKKNPGNNDKPGYTSKNYCDICYKVIK